MFSRHSQQQAKQLAYIQLAIQTQTSAINALGARMTEFANDQAHLDADVNAMRTAFSTGVAELKAQIAAGVPAQSLNFAALDALTTDEQAEAVADAPAVEPPAPAV